MDEDIIVTRNRAILVAKGYSQEEVYVEQAPYFENVDHVDFVYLLFKALYELK